MTTPRNLRTLCLLVLLAVPLLEASFEAQARYKTNFAIAGPVNPQSSMSTGGPEYNVTASPARLQEGSNTTITVETRNEITNTTVTLNVTDPSGASYTKMLSITINGTGFGSNSTQYWSNFTGAANTKHVGVYTITVNETLATGNFTVSLTNKLQYKRTETVLIRAVGFFPSENITISLKISNTSIAGYPKILRANNNGVLTDSWPIPSDATPGTYVVGLSSTANQTNQTTKTPADQDAFTVLGAICSVRTMNLANQAVPDSVVEVYNATSNKYLNLAGTTNSSGWALFKLDQGNYTFKAFFRDAQVGSLLNQNITADNTFSITLRLINIVATAKTVAEEKVEAVEVDLRYNYTMRDNKSSTQTASMLTNTTGLAELHNLFTNITYRVHAKRYDLLFLNTTVTVELSPPTPWINLELTLPDQKLNLRVLDSKGAPAEGVLVKIYEFSAVVTEQPLASFEISGLGNVTLTLPFGMYRLRAFEDDVLLSETTVKLMHDPTEFEFDLETANLDVTVAVHDYFGLPIANAEVWIYRRNNDQYIFVKSKSTGGDGFATFNSIAGGDSRIWVYVAGRKVASTTQFLASGSNQVTLKLNQYVAIVGFPIETGVFTVLSFIVALILVFLVLMRSRLTRVFRRQGKR